MKRILALVCALAMCSSVFGIELLVNGDLESWTGGVPDNWDLTNMDSGGNTQASAFVITQDTSGQHGGASCLEATNAASQWTYRYYAHTNGFQTAAWAGNATVSCWMRNSVAQTFTRMARGVFTGGICTVSTVQQITYTGTPPAWQQLSTTTWDTSTNPTRVSFHQITASTTGIDDVSVDGTVPVEVSAFTIE
jgi:hypothetical protein